MLKLVRPGDEFTSEQIPEEPGGDPAVGITLSTIAMCAFLLGLFVGLFANAIWIFFHAVHSSA